MLISNRVPIQSSLRTLLFPLMAAIAFAVIPCHAAEGDAAAPVVVLDTTGFWRNYNVLQPPVVQSGNGLERLKDATGERTWKTERDYLMREGVQDCEARIVLERALTDGSSRQRLPPELVARCEDTLRERTLHVNLATSVGDNPYGTEDWDQHVDLSAGGVWFVHSGWQERNRRLYALAGEVEKNLAAAK